MLTTHNNEDANNPLLETTNSNGFYLHSDSRMIESSIALFSLFDSIWSSHLYHISVSSTKSSLIFLHLLTFLSLSHGPQSLVSDKLSFLSLSHTTLCNHLRMWRDTTEGYSMMPLGYTFDKQWSTIHMHRPYSNALLISSTHRYCTLQ
jgi:hypothetical protein